MDIMQIFILGTRPTDKHIFIISGFGFITQTGEMIVLKFYRIALFIRISVLVDFLRSLCKIYSFENPSPGIKSAAFRAFRKINDCVISKTSRSILLPAVCYKPYGQVVLVNQIPNTNKPQAQIKRSNFQRKELICKLLTRIINIYLVL